MHWRHKGSHLHNNDASLVSRSAHVLCWQCALALSLSVRGPGRASPTVWLAGFAPLAACLAMTHVAVFRLTPNAAGRPSVTSYAYGLLMSPPLGFHIFPNNMHTPHPCTRQFHSKTLLPMYPVSLLCTCQNHLSLSSLTLSLSCPTCAVPLTCSFLIRSIHVTSNEISVSSFLLPLKFVNANHQLFTGYSISCL